MHRLTGAYDSTGEQFGYAYDAVGNRTVYTATTPLAGTVVTTYTYDAANRLLASWSADSLITYTWDARGNLIGDGVFTYTYNAAGRLVRAQSLTATLCSWRCRAWFKSPLHNCIGATPSVNTRLECADDAVAAALPPGRTPATTYTSTPQGFGGKSFSRTHWIHGWRRSLAPNPWMV